MSNPKYFALEPAIVARIKECLPEVDDAAVYTPFSVDDMIDLANDEVAVSIIYAGYRMGDSAGKGKAVSEYQKWLVVLSVRDVEAQQEQTLSLRAKADPFITKLLSALQGWNPNIQGYREFNRVDPGVGVGYESSYGYFPFMFESLSIVT